ncbi:MAG: hypothetical protein A3H69_02645 [Candidatus Sungbacteria bacterium RIFCSPLOWO2_02_FULL_47_9]|uniref:Uncharacterized protein n=1 Tax=Candidatus Sungbacteria bacterium RIFCSPHIGHO2_01_FULL_47_32 TaxID=1802264 RepID=A0A1G2K385_9BACT|nr:MAG: hypothetical protein UX72_C0015G0013 [Parcubacteria group bacterium GW2011_GWA2_47_10]OGZ93882.1 MAG: hypothetical protein A2633_05190 [Candidatus Sungbacteria bacterium RIFCSPHIGHO2_01_FULL_47_32]OGZ99134.1 MAG: hypothetical protein A3D57_05240 [Candidatus Sungbacteria bacterium RIFCSPHIGHO2_02_FULL_46_12]OHA06010.1 MAG: hypothetical protein A3A28_05250 [Candidatus Sungbacteria bacterium RIFCSPLOWO2_01_FULL_47_32]OHA09644.1 MAG: hypothetical protein A3H69_02645 [Candidatus Sungbacteria
MKAKDNSIRVFLIVTRLATSEAIRVIQSPPVETVSREKLQAAFARKFDELVKEYPPFVKSESGFPVFTHDLAWGQGTKDEIFGSLCTIKKLYDVEPEELVIE